jgi:hypothetical protein
LLIVRVIPLSVRLAFIPNKNFKNNRLLSY